MKGVVLAGGEGTRLRPITKVTNKHLLPIYNKPMIYYAIEALASFGIKDVLVVTGKDHTGSFAGLLGSGHEFGVNLTYKVQEGSLGIAHALGLAGSVFEGEDIVVILGDNIFNFTKPEFEMVCSSIAEFGRKKGTMVFLKQVDNPARFGVPVFDGNKKIVAFEEKPKVPKSSYALTGLYMVDNTAFARIKKLKPSGRGELEMTDLINMYLAEGKLDYRIIESDWTDAGTFESLFKANELAKKMHDQKS